MRPRRRLVPRWLTDQWTWIATLSIVFLVIRFATPLGNSLQTIGSGLVSLVLVTIAFISVNMLRPAPGIKYSRRVVSWLWFIMPFIIFGLVAGTDLGRWGGLFLTFMLTIVGIVASFPIGVLLALGRRADGLPAVKYACIAFIELVRGVPLITVLFLASLALPLVSPQLDTVPQAVRAMVAITLFSAAYLAENVRGGLQSIPPGQAEAARALGMNPVQVTVFITLPQALRAVIPALVGQCIALFKDTSLVAIVGLLDLTKSADSVVAQAEYIGLRREVYVFISVIYFVFSYAMGYVSRKIEQSGSGTARQTKL
jgi:general L-amino acid transport system permease protein